MTVALNHDKIVKHSVRKTEIKPLIDKYSQEAIHYPSEKDDWKEFEEFNLTITLNVLHVEKEKKHILLMF